MAKEQLDIARKSKFFKPWDIAAYIIILIIVAATLIPLLIKGGDGIKGVSITYKNAAVAQYLFDGGLTVYETDGVTVTLTEEENADYITVQTNEGYNVIFADKTARSVTVTQADCSKSADCTRMKITSAADSIICVPHLLAVTPIAEGKLPADITV